MTTITDSASGINANWLAGAWTNIQINESSTGGILGALSAASSTKYQPGSVVEFLSNTSAADAFTAIGQNTTSAAISLTLQTAQQVLQQRQADRLKKVFDQLQTVRDMVQPKNVLDPVIFFDDGSTLDTNANILTRSDGKKFDSVTGAPYVDPASIVQMANGAYLDTMNNILTMPDGTRIDTVTGLKITA